MAVIRCPYCKKYISSKLTACPECGKLINNVSAINTSSEDSSVDTTVTIDNGTVDAPMQSTSDATVADSPVLDAVGSPETDFFEPIVTGSSERDVDSSPATVAVDSSEMVAPCTSDIGVDSSPKAVVDISPETSTIDSSLPVSEEDTNHDVKCESNICTTGNLSDNSVLSMADLSTAADSECTCVVNEAEEVKKKGFFHKKKKERVKKTFDSAKEMENYKEKKPWYKPTVRKVLVILFFLVVIGGIVFFIVADKKREEGIELRAYERLQNCTNLLWYEDYIMRFPHGKHITEVKSMYEKARKEQDEFALQAAQGNKDMLLKYIADHPSSPYIKICENRIDSLDWDVALSANTKESYLTYLEEHPSGIFVESANENKNMLVKQEVTSEERGMLRGSIDSFLSAMASCDATRVNNLAASSTLTFCGANGSDGNDVVGFYSSTFDRDDVLGVHFSVNGGLNITKKPSVGNQGAFDYTVSANLDVTLNRSSVDSVGVQKWKITAHLTPDRKFKSVDLRLK